jgi:hypothetical protein
MLTVSECAKSCTPDIFYGTGFAAEVTFSSGHVETQHGFFTRAGALDCVAERLVVDSGPRERGVMTTKGLLVHSDSI